MEWRRIKREYENTIVAFVMLGYLVGWGGATLREGFYLLGLVFIVVGVGFAYYGFKKAPPEMFEELRK